MVVRARVEDTPSKPKSSEEEEEKEGEEEGAVTLPPHSPARETLSSLGDIFLRQAGVAIDTRRPKQAQIDTGPLTGSPS
jgi:hypothetical protein